MKKYAWIFVVVSAFVFNSGSVFAGTPVKVAGAAPARTPLSSAALSAPVAPKAHQLTCTASNFVVSAPSSGKASVNCYTVQEATQAEYDSTMPSGATNYKTDNSGTKDQWEVTTTSGRSGAQISYTDYTCPAGFTIKRVSGYDQCTKTVEVAPALQVK